jgi:hypothetical protein
LVSLNAIARLSAGGIILLALVSVPAPLLPPHRLAEAVQAMAGIGLKAAYLVTAVGLQIGLYGSLGVLATFTVNRESSLRWRLLQILAVPLVVVGLAAVVRFLKLGHVPMFPNVVVAIAACLFGVALGFSLRYRGWKSALVVAVTVIAVALWGFLGTGSAELSRDTEVQLRRIVAAIPAHPPGEARFGALLQVAFAALPSGSAQQKAVLHNRAAILALGIVVGHEGLARFAGLNPRSELVQQAITLRQGVTLRGREDWSRHYLLSAALAIMGNALVSDAGGLVKEELDALTQGSGFSFGDLAADRAGVRFAAAATSSEAGAKAMQARLRSGFVLDEFFPSIADLPENLSVAQFRGAYGGVGSTRYRKIAAEIEARMDRCAGLSASE